MTSVGPRSRPTATGSRALDAPFVGRATELNELVAALDDALAKGHPRFVLVDGAAGIGKSRLVREFLAVARDRAPAAAILQGRCLAANRGVSYWALGEVLRRACGIGLDDRADDAESRLRTGVARMLEPLKLSAGEAAEALHALATSAGIAIAGRPLERADPRLVPALIVHAWAEVFRAYAKRGGAILVIEDLHWAGSAIVSALPLIAARLDGPFLLVATARPAFLGREPGYMAEQGLDVLAVPSLDDGAAADLADAILSVGALGDDLRSTALGRAEGNPYFIEETVRHLVETRAVDRAAVPSSIQAVLVARIEGLPLAERRVLQEASVVGRVFWEGPIRLTIGAADIADDLGRLTERGLVFTRPTSSLSGEVELSFKHALLRDAAYGTMTAAHRARSHASVAAWLEQIAADHESELAGLISEHYRQAVEQDADVAAWADAADRERVRAAAVRYLMLAGTNAHQRFALDKALELHEAALRHATTDAERARALAAIGRDHESALDGPRALDAYRRAISEADAAGLPRDERAQIRLTAARTLAMRWGSFPVRPNPVEIDELVDSGLDLAESPDTRLWLLAVKGAAGMRWGPPQLSDPAFVAERLSAVAAAADGARQRGLADLSVVADRFAAQLEFAAGRYAECGAAFRAMLPSLGAIESLFQRALTSMYAVIAVADVEGDYAAALPVARDVLAMGRRLSAHEHAHGTAAILWCQYHLGQWSDATTLVDEHLAALRGSNVYICPYMRGGSLVGALIAAHVGDTARARAMFDQVQPDEKEPGMPEALRARVLVALGDAEEGVAIAQAIIDGGRVPSVEENDQESIALVEGLQALGDWDRLRGFLPEARRRAAAIAILEPVCDRAEGAMAAAAGATGDATLLLRGALDGFERLGVPYEAARTKTLLAGVVPDGDAMLAEATATVEALLGSAASTPAAVAPGPTPASSGGSLLSEREREVLELIGEGISNQEIAERLVLSQRTVERHVSNIYLKLGLEGRSARAAAASYAVRASLRAEGR